MRSLEIQDVFESCFERGKNAAKPRRTIETVAVRRAAGSGKAKAHVARNIASKGRFVR